MKIRITAQSGHSWLEDVEGDPEEAVRDILEEHEDVDRIEETTEIGIGKLLYSID